MINIYGQNGPGSAVYILGERDDFLKLHHIINMSLDIDSTCPHAAEVIASDGEEYEIIARLMNKGQMNLMANDYADELYQKDKIDATHIWPKALA